MSNKDKPEIKNINHFRQLFARMSQANRKLQRTRIYKQYETEAFNELTKRTEFLKRRGAAEKEDQ